MKWRALALVVAFAGAASTGTAQAEQCVTVDEAVYQDEHTVCLVTDTSQPLLTPTTIQFRANAQATSLEVSGGGTSRLVAPAAPGGRSLWETSIPPVNTDGSTGVDDAAITTGGSTVLAFQCKLDRESFVTVPIPKTYRHLKPGRHIFRVRTKDALGQTDTPPATKRCRIPK